MKLKYKFENFEVIRGDVPGHISTDWYHTYVSKKVESLYGPIEIC